MGFKIRISMLNKNVKLKYFFVIAVIIFGYLLLGGIDEKKKFNFTENKLTKNENALYAYLEIFQDINKDDTTSHKYLSFKISENNFDKEFLVKNKDSLLRLNNLFAKYNKISMISLTPEDHSKFRNSLYKCTFLLTLQIEQSLSLGKNDKTLLFLYSRLFQHLDFMTITPLIFFNNVYFFQSRLKKHISQFSPLVKTFVSERYSSLFNQITIDKLGKNFLKYNLELKKFGLSDLQIWHDGLLRGEKDRASSIFSFIHIEFLLREKIIPFLLKSKLYYKFSFHNNSIRNYIAKYYSKTISTNNNLHNFGHKKLKRFNVWTFIKPNWALQALKQQDIFGEVLFYNYVKSMKALKI